MSGANYTTSYSYDWDDRATDIQYGDATHRVRYGYDGQGKTALVSHNGVTYSYLYNLQGDVIGCDLPKRPHPRAAALRKYCS